MLQISYLRDQKSEYISGLAKRNYGQDAIENIEKAIGLDDLRKKSQLALDQKLSESKKISSTIGDLYKSGDRAAADEMKSKVGVLKETISGLQEEMKGAMEQLEAIMLQLPNMPNEKVPSGKSDADNEVSQEWSGTLPDLGEQAKPHWELAKQYKIFDLELGTKITGSGFPVFRGKGARLQRALINFFLDEAIDAGYEEFVSPLLVNEASARGTGSLPDKDGQMYYVEKDDLYMIPTAEIPITNVVRGEILGLERFPIKMCGYTPCFRREAGSYGAHVRGLNRVHQFDKVEIVQIAHPDKSYEVLEEMKAHIGRLLTKLELPFRILTLCGGDLTFASSLTYDFEVYSAAQKRWLEVSSVSNFESFQANRMKLRYRGEDGKTQLAHTLNGSALALPRIVASMIENFQSPEGIKIPSALQPYTGFNVLN